MIVWVITDYGEMYGNIERWIAIFQNMSAGQNLSLLGKLKATGELSESWKKMLADDVAALAVEQCNILGLDVSLELASQLEKDLRANRRYSPELMLKELEKLKQAIVKESSRRKLAFILPSYDQYFEQEKLFGEKVYDVFDTARQDVKDAGNCLAAELSTASVFHLMRVAEHGLRKLAKKLHVKLTHTGKPMPIEFGNWEDVIKGIKNKIDVVRRLPKGPKRQAKLEAYSNAANHCEYMKDVWLNNMAHARRPFTQTEALAVMERVRDFMRFLGKHLSDVK